MVLHNRAHVALHQQDYRLARSLFLRSLTKAREMDIKELLPYCLVGLARVAVVQGRPQQAARIFGAGEKFFEEVGLRLEPADRAEFDRNVASALASLGEEAFAAAWAQGKAMTLDEAVQEASGLGEAAPSGTVG